jgi:ribosomal protein S3
MNLFKEWEIRYYTRILLNSLGLFPNEILSRKTSTKTQVYSKTLTQEDIVGFWSKSRNQTAIYNIKKFESKYKLKPSQKGYGLNILGKSHKPLFLSGQLLADYISRQISLTRKLKDESFKSSLTPGLKHIIRTIGQDTNLSGLKITCSGKWRKTRSGRKETITCSHGRLLTQSMSSVGTFGFSMINTKFGACGVKVWISYTR